MSDILKGLTSGGWSGIFAWVTPFAVATALFWFFVYFPMRDPPLSNLLWPLPSAQISVALFGIAAVTGLLASASSTPLYRLLEGYAWPAALRDNRAAAHRSKKAALAKKVNSGGLQGVELGLLLEKFARYPYDDSQVAPTRLGNAIRSFETYGSARFNLDAQTLWSELCSVVPEYLQKDIDQARAIVDFFVSAFYASLLFGVLALACGISEPAKIAAFIFAVLALLACWGTYEMAVRSCSYWRATNQALVNLGRSPLARSLGLALPRTLADEKEMWSYLTSYVYYGVAGTGEKLDRFRRTDPEPPVPASTGRSANESEVDDESETTRRTEGEI
jgi:hypothetical protein